MSNVTYIITYNTLLFMCSLQESYWGRARAELSQCKIYHVAASISPINRGKADQGNTGKSKGSWIEFDRVRVPHRNQII